MAGFDDMIDDWELNMDDSHLFDLGPEMNFEMEPPESYEQNCEPTAVPSPIDDPGSASSSPSKDSIEACESPPPCTSTSSTPVKSSPSIVVRKAPEEVHLPTNDAEPKIKRRRFWEKQPVRDDDVCSPAHAAAVFMALLFRVLAEVRASVHYVEDFLPESKWRLLPPVSQRVDAVVKVRNFYVRVIHGKVMPKNSVWFKLKAGAKQVQARAAWAKLSTAAKTAITNAYIFVVEPPKYVLLSLSGFLKSCDEMLDSMGCIVKGKFRGILLTWHMPVDFIEFEVSPPPPDSEPTAAIDELVYRLKHIPAAVTVWDKFKDFCFGLQAHSKATDVACCLEVCPNTFMSQGKIQLHGHAFLRISQGAAFLNLSNPDVFKFAGAKANVSENLHGLSLKGARFASWAGYHYCCIDTKFGTVWTASTKAPYTGFLVNPSWIMHMVQAEKLAPIHARPLLVKCISASRFIKELDNDDNEREAAAVSRAHRLAQVELAADQHAWKTFPEVVAFMAQFEGNARHRYKFLVLDGPSQMGKTIFARTFAKTPQRVLEVNCASGKEPDLRAYRLRHHDVLFFDEIVPSQVLAQRKLFQACAAPVQLGSSATNCHSYSVFVWRKFLVLCSNNWNRDLDSCLSGDKDWLQKNSIVLSVSAPMWHEPTPLVWL